MSHALGLDLGSSSVKASLLELDSGRAVASAASPETELPIQAPQPGWAEQDPETWWEHAVAATKKCLELSGLPGSVVQCVGISYQMHGLVCINQQGDVLRPSIIWCDSRAVEIGDAACREIGPETCLRQLLNSPGNFTASKLKWVQQNEPEIYDRVDKIMLPGDWLAYRLTGTKATTASGLSEGILWDFLADAPAGLLLDYYRIDPSLLADVVPTFAPQGEVTAAAAADLGIAAGVPVSYRAGDQPNNALSLNVLEPGELAATAGTSGVVYGVSERADADPQSRVNTFVHVNHHRETPRYGVLMCVNGAGICNSWLKHQTATLHESTLSYAEMNQLAAEVPVGCEGLSILPYGNGAERTLQNRDLGAVVHGLNFNVHSRSHLLRAGQEGVAFSLKYGIDAMAAAGVQVSQVRAGNANMFLSKLFGECFANVSDAAVELYDTDGAQGAARGAAYGAGLYSSLAEAMAGLEKQDVIEPKDTLKSAYQDSYQRWLGVLEKV